MDQLDIKLNQVYAGRVVRKDLTKRLKEGASVPVYVLEYLLGMYCATDDDQAIEQGIQTVKKILAENYVRPDEAESVKSKIRERGRFTVIDRLTVKLNEKADIYQASFTNLGLKSVKVEPEIVTQNQNSSVAVFGALCRWNTNQAHHLALFYSPASSRSKCQILIFKNYWQGAQSLPAMNG